MRKTAFTLVLGLAGLLAGPASAAAPYPPSTSIAGISWDASSCRWGGTGGDMWPITWSAEGPLVSAWGDGLLSCTLKASYGVAAITSDPPSTDLAAPHCGPTPHGKGKMMALLDAGGLRDHCTLQLFVCATNVKTGKIQVFSGEEASAWSGTTRCRLRPGRATHARVA